MFTKKEVELPITPMKPIDFRFYDTHQKKMFGDAMYSTVKPGDDGQVQQESINKALVVIQTQFIIMQFTGIFDMNKTKIYDGDIVTYHVDPDLIADNWKPICKKYFKGGIPFVIKVHDVLAIDLQSLDGSMHNDITHFDFNNIEVVGNIHEHKKILSEAKKLLVKPS